MKIKPGKPCATGFFIAHGTLCNRIVARTLRFVFVKHILNLKKDRWHECQSGLTALVHHQILRLSEAAGGAFSI